LKIVVDSSVIVKWFVVEEGRPEALMLLEDGKYLLCPDFAFAEVTNAIRRKIRSGELKNNQAIQIVQQLGTFFNDVVPLTPLLPAALALSESLDHSIYDCIFLAAACEHQDMIVVTDDKKFAYKAVSSGFGDKIRLLRNEPLILEISDQKLKELLRLVERLDNTVEFVESSLRKQADGTMKGSLKLQDISPAYDSPVYEKLKNLVGQLDESVAQSIIAISWYGREIGSLGFEQDFENASNLAYSPIDNAPYIIGLLRHYELGLNKLKSTHQHLFEKQSDNDNG